MAEMRTEPTPTDRVMECYLHAWQSGYAHGAAQSGRTAIRFAARYFGVASPEIEAAALRVRAWRHVEAGDDGPLHADTTTLPDHAHRFDPLARVVMAVVDEGTQPYWFTTAEAVLLDRLLEEHDALQSAPPPDHQRAP